MIINTTKKPRKKYLISGLTIALSAGMVMVGSGWFETEHSATASVDRLSEGYSTKAENQNLPSRNSQNNAHLKDSSPLIGMEDLDDMPKNDDQKAVYFAVMSAKQYQNSTALGPLPKAIQGITLPTLSYDQYGNIIATESLMQLIEHFLSVAQQDGRDLAIARIEEYLQLALPSNAAGQAYDILQDYLAYKNAEPDLHIPIDAMDIEDKISAMYTSFDQRKQLRREHLGSEVAEAFFANEEAYKEYSFSNIKVRANSNLSDAERETIILNAEAKLPEDMRQRVSQKRQEANLKIQISALQKQGGKEQEIYNLRTAQYGEETAKKLAYFEARPESWLERVERYNTNKNQIQSDSTLNKDEKQSLIQQMKANEFSNKEIFKLAYQNIKQKTTREN